MKTGRRKNEWFADESLWRETFPYIFPEARFASADEAIGKALALTHPTGKSALDLCCGPGRCAIPLSRRGFTVTGVDRSRYLLGQARTRARKARAKIEWVLMDMRDFVRNDAYDLALSMFTSFGYFEDPQEDVAVLRNIFSSLRPRGAFLIEMNGKEILASRFAPSSTEELADGSIVIERRQIMPDWTRIRNQWIVIRGDKVKKFMFHLNLYSGQELRDRLEHVGFVDVKLYGSLEGHPYGATANRLIAVARKP